jgi:hypothetical protein
VWRRRPWLLGAAALLDIAPAAVARLFKIGTVAWLLEIASAAVASLLKVATAAALLAVAPAARAQAPEPAFVLNVVLADGSSHTFSRAELERLPAETAQARVRDGAPFTVTGVSVTALLRAAGLDLSANLGGGQVVGHALVARAADGYRAVFGLAELDPHFGHPPVLVNWANADGSALPARVGPLQLIATGESRPSRWVRQLQALEVKNLP